MKIWKIFYFFKKQTHKWRDLLLTRRSAKEKELENNFFYYFFVKRGEKEWRPICGSATYILLWPTRDRGIETYVNSACWWISFSMELYVGWNVIKLGSFLVMLNKSLWRTSSEICEGTERKIKAVKLLNDRVNDIFFGIYGGWLDIFLHDFLIYFLFILFQNVQFFGN